MHECESLDEVRANIDRIDERLVALLAERARYVAQAARFKPTKAAVSDAGRLEAVIRRVRSLAEDHQTEPDLIEALYRALIAAYTAFERKVWVDEQEDR